MISTKDFWKGRDEVYKDELTQDIIDNSIVTIDRVNSLLMYLGFGAPHKTDVSSGWRPASVNKAVGGAKKSSHMIGKAVDLVDNDHQIRIALEKAMVKDPDLLKKFKLNLEAFKHTPNWVHLDTRESLGYKVFTI